MGKSKRRRDKDSGGEEGWLEDEGRKGRRGDKEERGRDRKGRRAGEADVRRGDEGSRHISDKREGGGERGVGLRSTGRRSNSRGPSGASSSDVGEGGRGDGRARSRGRSPSSSSDSSADRRHRRRKAKAYRKERKRRSRKSRSVSAPPSPSSSLSPSASPTPSRGGGGRKLPEPSQGYGDLYLRLLRYVVRNRTSKLRKRLRGDRSSGVLRHADSHGQTLLHHACACGHSEVAAELIKRGADLQARDLQGNTPAHVAALRSHLVLLATLLQSGKVGDIDSCVNHEGQSVRTVAERAMAAQAAAVQGIAHGAAAAAVAGAAAAAVGVEGALSEGSSEEWRRKLRDVDSDGEWYGGPSSPTHEGQGGAASVYGEGAAPGVETEDEWAHRLWREMQERRKARSSASAFFADRIQAQRAAAAAAAAEAAAAARQRESERILREEQARDAEWRRRAMGGAAGPPPPPLPPGSGVSHAPPVVWDFHTLRTEYERKWEALRARVPAPELPAAKAGSLTKGDVPWPLPGWLEGQGGLEDVREVLLWGAAGPSEVKRRLREEILRWHPDKFSSRYGAAVLPDDREAVMQGVQRVCQHLTQLMGGGGARS